MDKNTVVIAIDHGWSNMKTVHETFTSGIREVTTEPALFENVLEKDGKYYKVGSERLKVKSWIERCEKQWQESSMNSFVCGLAWRIQLM